MRERLPERALDVLRAFAVLCVLFDHTTEVVTGRQVWLSRIGLTGVLIFFVHTSLVLMASLERSDDRPWQFYLRRAFRIYPLSIVTVLVVVALRLPFDATGWVVPVDARNLFANLTLTTNIIAGSVNVIGTLWSLPLEVQMYVLLPACFVVACRGMKSTLGLYTVALVLWAAHKEIGQFWRLSVLHYGPVFLLGVIAFAWLRASGRVRDFAPSRLTQIAKQIAKYSYGIYLLHIPAEGVAFVWGASWPSALQWSVWTVLVVTLPVAAYHLIEQPGITWGKRLANKVRTPARLDPAP